MLFSEQLLGYTWRWVAAIGSFEDAREREREREKERNRDLW